MYVLCLSHGTMSRMCCRRNMKRTAGGRRNRSSKKLSRATLGMKVRGVPGNPPGWRRNTNFHEIVPGNDEIVPGNPLRRRTNTNFDEIALGSPPGGRRDKKHSKTLSRTTSGRDGKNTVEGAQTSAKHRENYRNLKVWFARRWSFKYSPAIKTAIASIL